MSRHHPRLTSFARRLRPTPLDFAAAASLQDLRLLLLVQVTRPRRER
jgi:hypothetical protein